MKFKSQSILSKNLVLDTFKFFGFEPKFVNTLGYISTLIAVMVPTLKLFLAKDKSIHISQLFYTFVKISQPLPPPPNPNHPFSFIKIMIASS